MKRQWQCQLAHLKDKKVGTKYGVIWTNGPIKTLGITISNDPAINAEHNFDPRLKVMTETLNIWLSRNLSLKGKITILKAIALPKLLYVASNVPITTDVLQSVEK